MNITIHKYKDEIKDQWDFFVENSKNGTFLFKRDFLEYHKDRFEDYSLMIFEDDKLVAVLPANKFDEHTLISHEGLTYGGFVVNSISSVNKILRYLEQTLKWLFENNILKIKLKHLPNFYSQCSQNELEYAFYLLEADCYRIDTAFAYEYKNTFNKKLPKGRKSEIKKAEKLNVKIEETQSFDFFWNSILTPNLQSRFKVNPIHTLKEITTLKVKNNNNIKQFNAILDGEIVAGTTIFETNTTAHVQYLAGNEKARISGALDYLFYFLINYYSEIKNYFDFGIVNENQGKKINFGMMKWKESFGTRVFLHRFFEIQTKNYEKLTNENLSLK